jgi:RNA polymerase sigma-70 factor (ECF subfamily)
VCRAIDSLRRADRERREQRSLATYEVGEEMSLNERKAEQWRSLLVDLPDTQAEVLVLRAIEGYSIEEIAELTSVPHETVRSRLRLAKASARARIKTDPAFADLASEVE